MENNDSTIDNHIRDNTEKVTWRHHEYWCSSHATAEVLQFCQNLVKEPCHSQSQTVLLQTFFMLAFIFSQFKKGKALLLLEDYVR